MQHTISNGTLSATIKSKGAELSSVKHQQLNLEYMWGADPTFWGKSSPILFPNVGQLKDNIYHYKNQAYSLPRHGFARDEQFAVESTHYDKVVFVQRDTEASLKKYPFPFELRLIYQLVDDTLLTTYQVTNTGKDDLFFSIGGHPAFKVPLIDTLTYNDYYLEFDQLETAGRWIITKEGLIDTSTEPLLQNEKRIPLTHGLFDNDAIVLKHLNSKNISLRSDKNAHGLSFNFEGFPFLGIWAAKNSDFVCIEPWCGIADSVTHNQEFIMKEGIEKLTPGQRWDRTWKVKFF